MVKTEHPKMGTMTGPPLAKKSNTVVIEAAQIQAGNKEFKTKTGVRQM
jgi:hypothetical protein